MFDVFDILEEITCYNQSKFSGLEAFCVFLKCVAYPCCYSDLVPRFERLVPEVCMMSNYVMNMLLENFHHLLHSFNRPLLSQQSLELYAHAVHDKGAALRNCWGFVDGTVCSIFRPNEGIQRILYNEHKRIHALKFQSSVAPSILTANLCGPVEGRRHDSGMLVESKLLPLLQQYCYRANGSPLCIYGDPAYPLRAHLQRPFEGNHLSQEQKDFNKSMKTVCVSAEWVFKEIIRYFAFIDFKKPPKNRRYNLVLSEKCTLLVHF